MKLFSHRTGKVKDPDRYQIESISDALRNRLWNCLYNEYFRYMPADRTETLVYNVWNRLLKQPVDDLDKWPNSYIRDQLKTTFLNMPWVNVYDFIEFCSINTNNPPNFVKCINGALKEEFAGYTFINGCITPITDTKEISEIEAAAAIADTTDEHLKTALERLSDRKEPDYRNSIKESISAVEAMCNKIVGSKGITLSDALKAIERSGKIKFHGAEKAAFSALYGWTSDASGIRHGMMEMPTLDQEDARFMLISCSAFINYLKVKADKAGTKIN